MPFTPINFLGANTLKSPYGDLLKNAMEGYELARKPKQIAQEEQQRELQAKLTGLKGDELNQKITNPALYSNVPEASLYGLSKFYENKPESGGQPTEESRVFEDLYKKMLKKRQLELERTQQLVGTHDFASMTPEQKSQTAAIANKLGIPQTDLIEGLTNGQNLYDVAEAHGISRDQVDDAARKPKYLPTTGTATAGQTQQRFASERQILSDFITDALSEYPSTFNGYSLKQIADAIKGDNPEKQANFLAARALAPEVAGITAGMLSLPAGIRMMTAIQDKALTDVKALRPFITQDVYKATQKKISALTQQAFNQSREDVFGVEPMRKTKQDEHGEEPSISEALQKNNSNAPNMENNFNNNSMSDDEIRKKRALEIGEKILAQADKQGGGYNIAPSLSTPETNTELNVKPEALTEENLIATAKRLKWSPEKTEWVRNELRKRTRGNA